MEWLSGSWSFDLAFMQCPELVLIGFVHPMEQLDGLLRFIFVDLAHGKADMDQHPVTGRDPFVAYHGDVDVAPDARNLNFGNMIGIVYKLDDLAGNAQAHRQGSFCSYRCNR